MQGGGSKEGVDNRIKSIKSEEQSPATKERIANLSGGVGVIKVGAPTKVDMVAKKLKIEDAVNATKAAIEEGIVQGGGVMLATVDLPKLE